jgi:hypothetical protein
MELKGDPNSLMRGRIELLLKKITPRVRPAIIEQVTDLLNVGEYRIAVENLCELLYEDDVALSSSSRDQLLAIVKDIGLKERYWAIVPAAQD